MVGFKVKNTFVELEDPCDEEDHEGPTVRKSRTLPPVSFELDGLGQMVQGKLSVKFAEALEESDFEYDTEELPEEEEEGDDAVGLREKFDSVAGPEVVAESTESPTVVHRSTTARTPGSKASKASLLSSRCRAVTFWLPDEPSRLMVKNTFLSIRGDEDVGSPNVKASKSVPISWRPEEDDEELIFTPTVGGGRPRMFGRLSDDVGQLCSSSTQTTSHPASAVSQCSSAPGGVKVQQSVASVGASPSSRSVGGTPGAICHLRTLSFNADNVEGPHLGLLWAPIGQAWAPETSLALAPMVAVPPLIEASQSVSESAAEEPAVSGDIWERSQTPQGCREVQAMLEDASSDEERMSIALQLQGHIAEALKSPYANYVVTKIISSLPAESCQFILDELKGEGVILAAKHKFGCRAVQRLVEKCPPAQVASLVSTVLNDFDGVARHPYGNYVIQNLLENATDEQQHLMIHLIERDIRGLAADTFGCIIVGAALADHVSEERRLRVARALAREEGLIVFVACTRHGHTAVSRVLQVLEGDEREHVREELYEEVESLKASRFGKNVADML